MVLPKRTTHLWKYTNRRIRKDVSRDYYAISIPPMYYDEFLKRELLVVKSGAGLLVVPVNNGEEITDDLILSLTGEQQSNLFKKKKEEKDAW